MFEAIVAGTKVAAPYAGKAAVTAGSAIGGTLVAKKVGEFTTRKVEETLDHLRDARTAYALGRDTENDSEELHSEARAKSA